MIVRVPVRGAVEGRNYDAVMADRKPTVLDSVSDANEGDRLKLDHGDGFVQYVRVAESPIHDDVRGRGARLDYEGDYGGAVRQFDSMFEDVTITVVH